MILVLGPFLSTGATLFRPSGPAWFVHMSTLVLTLIAYGSPAPDKIRCRADSKSEQKDSGKESGNPPFPVREESKKRRFPVASRMKSERSTAVLLYQSSRRFHWDFSPLFFYLILFALGDRACIQST